MAYAQQKNTAPENPDSVSVLDQRREDRHDADGSICLILDHDGSEAVRGRLVDVSPSGFRAIHTSQEVQPGRVIRFNYEDRETGVSKSGWARVIWSRLQDQKVESGCYVVIAD